MLDGELLFSKKEAGRFPTGGEAALARRPPACSRLILAGHWGALLGRRWRRPGSSSRCAWCATADGAPPLPPPVAVLPVTTVLLPVRDEEENLGDCAASLLGQLGGPALRVIDDGSTDRTPEILAGLAGREPRLTALRARPLAAGWGGKVNALASGFDGVSTAWILLTDADTRHQPELLARAHAAAAEHRLDALSLSGRQTTAGLGEALLTPAAYALLDLLLGDWRPYARGEGPTPIANGQYFLVKTEALRTIGGFAAIAENPLDDVALATRLDGGRLQGGGFLRASDALQVSMYRGARAPSAVGEGTSPSSSPPVRPRRPPSSPCRWPRPRSSRPWPDATSWPWWPRGSGAPWPPR